MDRRLVLALCAACGDNRGTVVADASPDAGANQHAGEVRVLETNASGTDETSLAVSFAASEATVSSRDTGPCHVRQQITLTMTSVSAGAVTIAGSASGDLVSVPDAQQLYTTILVQRPLFAPADVVTISGAGASVPPFTGMVTFPSSLSVTEVPALLNTSGFAASWNATGGIVHVRITQDPDSAHELAIDCPFSGSSATGAIPAVALADLAIGTPAELVVATEASTSVMAGDYTLTFVASVGGLDVVLDVEL